MCSFSVLTSEQEQFLFKRLNYCRHVANNLREKIVANEYDDNMLREFEKMNILAIETRNTILNHNMRLVVNYLLNRGHMKLLRSRIGNATIVAIAAVDGFDWSKGTKLSTYLSWALIRSCHPWIEENITRLVHNRINYTVMDGLPLEDLLLDKEHPKYEDSCEFISKSIIRRLSRNGGKYSRMAKVIRLRYTNKLPMEDVGQHLGLSTESIRQISREGIKELKKIAYRQYPELVK